MRDDDHTAIYKATATTAVQQCSTLRTKRAKRVHSPLGMRRRPSSSRMRARMCVIFVCFCVCVFQFFCRALLLVFGKEKMAEEEEVKEHERSKEKDAQSPNGNYTRLCIEFVIEFFCCLIVLYVFIVNPTSTCLSNATLSISGTICLNRKHRARRNASCMPCAIYKNCCHARDLCLCVAMRSRARVTRAFFAVGQCGLMAFNVLLRDGVECVCMFCDLECNRELYVNIIIRSFVIFDTFEFPPKIPIQIRFKLILKTEMLTVS